jgi:hypothetical protein
VQILATNAALATVSPALAPLAPLTALLKTLNRQLLQLLLLNLYQPNSLRNCESAPKTIYYSLLLSYVLSTFTISHLITTLQQPLKKI